MKKLLIIPGFAALFTVLCISCNNSDKTNPVSKTDTEKPAINKTVNGITGTYSTTEDGQPMQFILKDDGTGSENYHGDMRPFGWVKKEGKIFFRYNGEANEFELPIDMEKGEIHYGSLVYKKE